MISKIANFKFSLFLLDVFITMYVFRFHVYISTEMKPSNKTENVLLQKNPYLYKYSLLHI